MTNSWLTSPLIRSRRAGFVAVAAFAAVALTAAGCSSSGGGASPTSPSVPTSPGAPASSGTSSTGASVPRGSGPVDVLYAGSLVALMENQIKPPFNEGSGYSFTGFSGGSSDLATSIKGKVRQGDVFVSASPMADTSLQGSANGSWVSWYGSFATAPLVLGINPKSKFAAQLKTKPWYDVVTESGFRLGSTDPATDPKGKLAVQALTDTATSKKLPKLASLAKSKDNIYPEETLVGRLQSGQLDAGFFYTAEATASKITTVPLTGTTLAATYTISILRGAPHEKGAEAFVAYLLGPNGQNVLKKDGFDLISPVTVTGTGVPTSLHSVLPSS